MFLSVPVSLNYELYVPFAHYIIDHGNNANELQRRCLTNYKMSPLRGFWVCVGCCFYKDGATTWLVRFR
jgi:hypothetical protein